MMITAAQCRCARTLLSWSVARLASAALVRESDIDDFELERRLPKTAILGTIRHALEGAGMEFLADDDVQLRARALRSPVIAGKAATVARRRRVSDRSGNRHRRSARARAGF